LFGGPEDRNLPNIDSGDRNYGVHVEASDLGGAWRQETHDMDVSCLNCERTIRAVGDTGSLDVQVRGRGRPVLCQACVRALGLAVDPPDLSGTVHLRHRGRTFQRPKGCNVFVGPVAMEAGYTDAAPRVLPLEAEASKPSRSAKRVLVVDDDPGVLSVVAEALRTRGYEVEGAHGGEQAMRLVEDQTFDLVVLDAVLPEHTGFIVLERLRWMDLHRAQQTPVIMMTGQRCREYRSLADRMNVFGLLLKPFPLQSLLKWSDEVLCA